MIIFYECMCIAHVLHDAFLSFKGTVITYISVVHNYCLYISTHYSLYPSHMFPDGRNKVLF